MYSFKVKRFRKTPEDVKFNILQNCYLGFFIFFEFGLPNSPKVPKNISFNGICNIQNFEFIKISMLFSYVQQEYKISQ